MKRLILTLAVGAALSCAALGQFSFTGGLYEEKETKTTLQQSLAIFLSARDAWNNRVSTFDGSSMRKPGVTRGMVLDGTIIPLNWQVETLDLKFVPLEADYNLDVNDPNGWIVGKKSKGDLAFRYKIDTATLPNGDCIWLARLGWRNRKDNRFVLIRWVNHPGAEGQQLLSLVVRELPPGIDPLTGKNTADLRGVELYPYTEGFTSLVASPAGVAQQTIIPGQQVEKKVDNQTQAKAQKSRSEEEEPEDIPVPARLRSRPANDLSVGFVGYDGERTFKDSELTLDEQQDPDLTVVKDNELLLPSTERAVIYIVSSLPIDSAKFLVGSKVYDLVPHSSVIGGRTIFFVRTWGKCNRLNGAKLTIKQGGQTRTVEVRK